MPVLVIDACCMQVRQPDSCSYMHQCRVTRCHQHMGLQQQRGCGVAGQQEGLALSGEIQQSGSYNSWSSPSSHPPLRVDGMMHTIAKSCETFPLYAYSIPFRRGYDPHRHLL